MKRLNYFAFAAIVLASAAGFNARGAFLDGIDVTSANGNINWKDVYADGITWAYARATTGYDYSDDSKFGTNMKNGKAAGLQMGAYEFSHMYADTPAEEATYFWNAAGPYLINDGKSLDPAIDFEVFSGHDGTSSYTAWLNDWATDVKAKTSSFMHPLVIASACTGMCDLTSACGLNEWVVNYSGVTSGSPWSECDECNYLDPGSTAGWTFWNYGTGDLSGVSGEVDLDYFNGSTVAELKAEAGI